MPIKTIVVALAATDDDQRIAERAVQLADQHQAQLIGVHVLDSLPPQDDGLPSTTDTAALANVMREQSEVQLRQLLVHAHRPASIQLETGKPHEAIEQIAARCHADLLIIGPGVARNLRENVFGSTADRLVRQAPCPVLVVRREVAGPYARVAVGLDPSRHAQQALHHAAQLSPGAALELIHAVQIPQPFIQAMLRAGTPKAEIERYRRARARTARQQIMEIFNERGPLPDNSRLKIIHGDPGLSLLRISRMKSIDLVAIGTQGAGAVSQLVLGSVARKVLSAAGSDVLTVSAAAVELRRSCF